MDASLASISMRYDQVFVTCGAGEFSHLLSEMEECRRQIEREFTDNPVALVASRLCCTQRLLVGAVQLNSPDSDVIKQFDELLEIAEFFSHSPLRELEHALKELERSSSDLTERKKTFEDVVLRLRRISTSIESVEG